MSLIRKTISYLSTLAATIGWKRPCFCSYCRSAAAMAMQSQGYNWFTVAGEQLLGLAPFWREKTFAASPWASMTRVAVDRRRTFFGSGRFPLCL